MIVCYVKNPNIILQIDMNVRRKANFLILHEVSRGYKINILNII